MDINNAGTVTGNAESLSVVLFLLSTAVSFFVPTLSPERRGVRIFLQSMTGVFLVAAFVSAVFWSSLSQMLPGVTSSMASLTLNVWAWFELVMVTLLVSAVLPAMERWRVGYGLPRPPVTVDPSLLKPTQVFYPYPSKNSMLWEWDYENGMLGPFCPTHQTQLYYWTTVYDLPRAEFKEDESLNGTGSFMCPLDNEEFIFIRPLVVRIRDLRANAIARFKSGAEHAKKNSLIK